MSPTAVVVALVVLRGSRSDDASSRERDAAREAGCEILHVLPHGVLVRGTESQLAQVAERDFRVETYPGTEVVQAGTFRWRLDEAPPVVAPELDIPSDRAATWPHRLVHLIGPPIPEWINEIKTRGATVIDNIGRYGLLISAPPDVAERVAALPWVTFTGPYRPAYRLAPSLLEKQGQIRFVVITVYPREGGAAVGSRVEQLGGRVARKSTRGPYASIVAELDAEAVRQVAQLPDVRSLSYLNPEIEPTDERSCQILTAQGGSLGYVTWLSDRDLTGKDITIAFADSGISPHRDLAANGVGTGRYLAAAKFNQPASTNKNIDALGHGTYVAGIAVGDGNGSGETDPQGFLLGQGIAPGADFVSLKLAQDLAPLTWEEPTDVDDWMAKAIALGASLMNNSWQTPTTDYDDVAQAVDTVVRAESLTMIVGAGNKKGSSRSVSVPGLSKNAITVGATESGRNGNIVDEIWSGSRVGPAPDGRLLPNVVAPGMIIVSTLARCGAPFIDTGGHEHEEHALGAFRMDRNLDCMNTAPVINLEGTSWAIPHVSGACALLSQAWVERHGVRPSPALLKAWIINGADDVGPTLCTATAHTPGSPGCLHSPNNTMGWGRVSLNNMLSDARGARLFFDEPMTFVSPGETYTQRLSPVDTALPMRVTLVWTDPPADPADQRALRHDLNLEVEAASGARFMGNVNFNRGFSSPVAPGATRDDINNVECVYIENPSGIYTVRVFAPSNFDVTLPSQTFALVIENAQLAPRLAPPAAPTGLVIVTDRSGSMQGSGFAAATSGAASLLLDLLPAGDEAAVLSFGTGATTEFTLAAIGDRSAKQAGVTAANGIAFGGCTFIGNAIEQSKQVLTNAVNPQRAILLLSDGFDNKGCQPLVAARPTALDAVKAGAAVPVHACAIGPAADHVLLEQVATESGGRYYYAPSEADLNEVYAFIRADINDVAVVANESFATSTRTVTAPVDRQATAVTFAVSWMDRALQLVATPPAAREIRVRIVDPNGRNVHLHATDVRTVSRPGHVTVHLEAPMPGDWKVSVGTAAGTHTRASATMFVESPIRLDARVNAVKLTAGSTLEIGVPADVLNRFGPKLKLTGRLISPAVSAADVLTNFKKKLKPGAAATMIADDGVPTNLARLLALNRMLRVQGKPGVFKQVKRKLVFRTVKGPGGKPRRVARARLDTPGSYNLVVVADGTTRSGRGAGKSSRVRRTVLKSILVIEGP